MFTVLPRAAALAEQLLCADFISKSKERKLSDRRVAVTRAAGHTRNLLECLSFAPRLEQTIGPDQLSQRLSDIECKIDTLLNHFFAYLHQLIPHQSYGIPAQRLSAQIKAARVIQHSWRRHHGRFSARQKLLLQVPGGVS